MECGASLIISMKFSDYLCEFRSMQVGRVDLVKEFCFSHDMIIYYDDICV